MTNGKYALRGRHLIAGLLGLAVTFLGLASHVQAEDRVWRHGVIEPKSDAGFVMMPAEARFTTPEGIRIELTPVQSDGIGLKSMLAGELDSYEGAPAGGIVAASHGADVKIIGCAWPQLVHGIFVRSEVKDIHDLKGHTFGISAPGSMPDFLIRGALKEAGMQASDVQFASLGGDTDRFKALSVGVVQGAVFSTEYIPVAPASIRLLVAGRDLMPNFLRGCFMTSGAALSKRRDDAVSFMAAEMAGLRYATTHKDDEVEATRKITHQKADDPRPGFLFDEATKHHDIDATIPLPVEKLAWMQDLLLRTGNLKAPTDLSKIADPSIRADAIKRLASQ